MRIRSIIVTLALCVMLHPAFAEDPVLDLKGTRVLVCAQYLDLMNLPAIQRLRAAGAEVRSGNLSELKWDEVKQYHLLIAVGQDPGTNAPVAVIERFVKSGGGLLFFRRLAPSENANAYLEPFGASILWEVVQDPSHTFRCPTGFRLPYAYTDNITPNHPVTAGVKAIWYSAEDRHYVHTSPLKASRQWTVLVRGTGQAKSLRVGGYNEEHIQKDGTCRSAPPIIAAREYGAGAIVLVGISPMEMFWGQGLPAYQDIAMEKGDGMRHSDLRRLYENALNWLAEHARQATELGQDELKPQENEWARADVPDWKQKVLPNDLCKNPARGVIGAHSKLSDGKVAPETLIQKARAVGLQWLAFTERLEDFSPAKWEQLRKICRQHSTPGFTAEPGLDYADASGTRYVVFGDFDWPPETVFSEDKQRIVMPQWWFNIKNMPNGPYDIAHAPLRPWDFSMYDCWPIRTTIAGKQVDEAGEAFRYLQGMHDDPFPMTVEMVWDEAQLEAAATRMANFILQDEPGDVGNYYSSRMYYSSHYVFVSDGPRVTDWRVHNGTRVSGGRWWVPGTEQYRVKLSAHSTVPITDVKIWDGPRLFRRFRPNQTNLTLTVDVPHDQQRQLFAEITDANGKRAVTGGLSIRDWLNFRFMCGDRGNSICDAMQTDEIGPYLTGPTATCQRKMTTFAIYAGYGERHFTVLPPDYDGGMKPAAFVIVPELRASGFKLQPSKSTLEQRIEVPVASRDGILQDESVVGYFPCNTHAWTVKCPPQDIRDVTIRSRYLEIVKRAHDPGVILVEGTVRFARELKLDAFDVGRVNSKAEPGYLDQYAFRTPSVTVAGSVAPATYTTSAAAEPGSYACMYPSLWGAAGFIMLDDGYRLSLYSQAPGLHLNVQLAGMPREVKAGDEIHYRYLVMTASLRDQPNTASWEHFVQTMGLRGAPAYEVKDVKAGAVKGTKFLLEVTPTDSGFVATIPRADLPIRLPVRVADINPNWTFAWFHLDRKEWFPSAVDPVINQGFFTIDTRRGAHRFFAGHPVVADNADVRIGVLSDGKSEVRATLNNVGDQPLKVTARLNPALGKSEPQVVELAAGGMKEIKFAYTPPAP